jgi:hypothetical protein
LARHDVGPCAGAFDTQYWDAYAYAAGRAIWAVTQCGNNCYQSLLTVARRGPTPSVPVESDSDQFGEYLIDPYGTGPRVMATAATGTAVFFSKIDYGVSDPDGCNEARGCGDFVAGPSTLWRLANGRWRRLPTPWPVGALASAGSSVALAETGGTAIEVRNGRTWTVTRTLTLPAPILQAFSTPAIDLNPGPTESLALSRSYVAALDEDGTVHVYRRADGSVLYELNIPHASAIAISDAALAVARPGSIVVVGPHGRRTSYAAGAVATVALSGDRLAWREGKTIKTRIVR